MILEHFIRGKKKAVQSKHTDVDRSYLAPQPTTNSIVDTMQGTSMVSPLLHSDAIPFLDRIEQSNRDLILRVEKIEKLIENTSVTLSVWRQQAQGVGQDVAVGQQAGTSHRPPPTLEAVRSSSDITQAETHL